MSFEDKFNAAVVEYLNSVENIPATSVNEVDQQTRNVGYGCETCDYTTTVIEISYNTADRHANLFTYRGDMGEFMRALT